MVGGKEIGHQESHQKLTLMMDNRTFPQNNQNRKLLEHQNNKVGNKINKN